MGYLDYRRGLSWLRNSARFEAKCVRLRVPSVSLHTSPERLHTEMTSNSSSSVAINSVGGSLAFSESPDDQSDFPAPDGSRLHSRFAAMSVWYRQTARAYPRQTESYKRYELWVVSQYQSAFNRVYICSPVNGWGCQYTASSVVEIMHGEGTPYSSSLNGQLLCSSCHASQ